ncbi:hypothetical protein LJR074_003665 [Acidovorax sp. LjRoot74]|uniref:hypothetical protein n=1 Tax=Acidovorax sp. LjRoot74 TaxID=3342337 RepID=UPI003ECF3731
MITTILHHYDNHGWYSTAEIPDRSTELGPSNVPAERIVGEPWPNFTGEAWVLLPYSEPPAPEAPAPGPTDWLIDIGPFFDRFGSAKMAVLTSADAGVKAILSDLQVRKWIDLQRPDVAQGLSYVGTKVAAVTEALQDDILTTPVQLAENLALRKLYFS